MASTSDKERALRLLKQYRDRLTGIGGVHYLEELAFLIQTFESPVFGQLLRIAAAATTQTTDSSSSAEPSETSHRGDLKPNGTITANHPSSSANVDAASNARSRKDKHLSDQSKKQHAANGVPQDRLTAPMSSVLSSPGSNSTSSKGLSASGHPVAAPGYGFYLLSGSSQVSNTDSWGSIDLPMGDYRPLDFEDHHMQNPLTITAPLKQPTVPATLSPLSQIPSSNKSSSSSVSVKSGTTVSDSIKGPPSDISTSTPISKSAVTEKKTEQLLMVTLNKGKEGLGFSVVGLTTEQKGDLGIFVQEIQKGGLAEKSGKLCKGDQILSINGRSLAGMSHNSAIKLLQKAKGSVELKIIRTITTTVPSPELHPIDLAVDDKRPCRRQIETISLKKEGKGFGFGIISGKKGGGVDICKIAASTPAARDGRLQVNDHLLQINNQNATSMSADDVMKILKGTKSSVKLVVARMVTGEQSQEMLMANEPDAELEKFVVELEKDHNGLGITIAGLEKKDTEEEQGIYVSSVAKDGPAGREGRIKEGDQVLQVNDSNLIGLENMTAAAVLRNAGHRVRLVIGRRRNQMTPDLPSSSASGVDLFAPAATRPEETTPLSSRESESSPAVDDSIYAVPLTSAEEESIKKHWGDIVGKDMIVVIAQFPKFVPDTGLGIRVEGLVDLDDNKQPVADGHHHIIELVREDGPVHKHGVLNQGDEILEVNGTSMINLEYTAAIEVIKATPHHVRIVAARRHDVMSPPLGSPSTEMLQQIVFKGPQSLKSYEETTSIEGIPTSESEDDKRMQTPEKTNVSLSSLPSTSTTDDFRWKSELARRRAERDSWRKRHEEEKERLRIRIEKSRQDIQKQLREKEAEFNRMQEELEREQRSLQELQREKLAAGDNSAFDIPLSYKSYFDEFGSSPTWDQLLSNHRKQQQRGVSHDLVTPTDDITRVSDSELGFGTDTSDDDSSSPEMPSPIPPSTKWCHTPTDVILYKGSRGLGFTILNFLDKDENNVILICSIVTGGVADRNGHLEVGDKLIAINRRNVEGLPLADVVDILTTIERGTVVITVVHKLSTLEEEKAFFGSMGGGSGEFPVIREEVSPPEASHPTQVPAKDTATKQVIVEPLMDVDQMTLDHMMSGDHSASSAAQSVTNSNSSSQQIGAHKRLFDLKETVNVTSTSSLKSSLLPGHGGVSEQLRRSMPDLLDKLPNGHDKAVDGVREKVNTLPHKRKQHKIASPTPISTFKPLRFATQPSQQSVSPVRNSLSLSMTSAFSRVTPDKLTDSPTQGSSEDSHLYQDDCEMYNEVPEGVAPINGVSGGAYSQQQGGNRASVDMPTSVNASAVSQDGLPTSTFQHTGSVQSSPAKSSTDRRQQILQPLQPSNDSQPRMIVIPKGNTGLGMSLACDAETDSIVVKNILSGSAVGRDGRIRIGDCIIAINRDSLEGISLSQAKAMLRSASLNPAGVTITYIPCPQGYVPTIATGQPPTEQSQLSNPSSPDAIEYENHFSEQSIMLDQHSGELPVREVSHNLPEPLMLPAYPGSHDMVRPLPPNRMSYQSIGITQKQQHLSNHPYSDSNVTYQPANPYSNYRPVQPSVYSVPNTPRVDSIHPPPSYELHMMTRKTSHSDKHLQQQQQQQVSSQPRQQFFTSSSSSTGVVSAGYLPMEQPHLPPPQQQQQKLHLSPAPPSYPCNSPIRMTTEQQQQQQSPYHAAGYQLESHHSMRYSDPQQQQVINTGPPGYPMEPSREVQPHQQQQQVYYMSDMHYSQQHLSQHSPAHLDTAGTSPSGILQSGTPPGANYQMSAAAVSTSHMISLSDSFSQQQQKPPPSYESYVRTSVHRQSRSQSPITTSSPIPHQHSASDSIGKTSSSSLVPARPHQRDPATGAVSNASRSPSMTVRGQLPGQYSPLLNKTDSKSRSGGDLHIKSGSSELVSNGKVLRNASSGALRRFSGSTYLTNSPQYMPPTSGNHVTMKSDGSIEDAGSGKLDSGPSVYEVELTKDANGSLGISIVGSHETEKRRDEAVGGVYINTITPPVKGKLKSGDKILEVSGKSLLQCTEKEAVEIIQAAASPVKLLVQSCYSHLRVRNRGSQQRGGGANKGGSPSGVTDGRRAAIHSWYIEEEEDPRLRKTFPDAEGHLFEVTLQRDGKSSLGMNLVPNQLSMTKGVIITVVQPGGVADSSGKIKPGDEILQVDDVLVMDMKQEEVVALLKRPSTTIHLVLVRPMAHLMGLHLQIPRGSHTNMEQSGLDHMFTSPTHFDDDVDGVTVNSHTHSNMPSLPGTKTINLTRDNDQGLGFSVLEEKVNKKMVVMVKDIVLGGPAYMDGRLQVGDILLSVDGESVVGKPYQLALQLLQQTKTRGSASLVFSHAGTSPGHTPIAKETSPPVIPSLPLTTQDSPTRDTGKSSESVAPAAEQGSSSRKNSIVDGGDYSTRVVGRKKSSKKSSLGRKAKAKSDSHHQSGMEELESNMTRLQKKPTIEIPDRDFKDNAADRYEEFEVEINKGGGSLGLKVVGGADTTVKGVLIKEIVPNTQADIDGQLRPGDRILKVDAQDLKHSTHLQAMQTLWNSGPVIKLFIQRKMSVASEGNLSFSESLHSPCMEVEVIEVMKPDNAGLGLIIGSREDRDGVFVDEVVVKGAARKDGRIRSGDKILAINGQDVSMSQQDLVAATLQSCKGKVSLTVGHAVGMSPVKDRSPDLSKFPLSIGPPVEVHHPQKSPPSYPGYSNDDNMEPNRSSSSLKVTSSANHYNSDPTYHHDTYPLRYHSSSPPVRLSPQMSRNPPPYPTAQQHHMGSGDPHVYNTTSQDSSVHKEIKLHKGSSGLGFAIAGGNEVPIYINNIAKDGVADKDGRLQSGDQLIAVNGINIQGTSYQYALETLKKVHGEVTLTITPST